MISISSRQASMMARSTRPRIRLLAIIEASTVTGPAKNLFEFCRISRNLERGPIVETSLLTFHRVGGGASGAQLTPTEFAEEALRAGVPLHCVPERFTFAPQVLSDLKQTVDRVAPDIIQTHGLKSHFLVRACGAHKRRVWVAFHHGYTLSTARRALLAQLDRWSLRAPAQVVTVSRAFARQLSDRGIPGDRIMVLHNAVDPDQFWREVEQKHAASEEGCRDASVASGREWLVLAVGRLSREKAFPDLVGAIRCLKDVRPGLAVRLMIVGEGGERRTIEEAIRRTGLERQVHLIGHVADVRPYYQAADVLVISSLSEGSPNVLLEAMAAGIPVVATAVGGIPEIVTNNETALLVSPCDPTALATAIERVLCDRDVAMAMARRARELTQNAYSPLCRVRSLVKLYERLCFPVKADSSPVSASVVTGNASC